MPKSQQVIVGIDESGKTTSKGGHDVRNPFFVVAAACIDARHYATLDRGFRLVSHRWFGNLANANAFELHASELVNGSPRYRGSTVDRKIGFLDELGRVLRMLHVEVFVRGVCKRSLPMSTERRYAQGVVDVVEELGALDGAEAGIDFKMFADSHEAPEAEALAKELAKIGRSKPHGVPSIQHVDSHANVLIQIADLFAYFSQRRMTVGLGLISTSGPQGRITEHFQTNLAPIARVDRIWFPKEQVFLSTAKPDFSLVARTAQSIQSRRAHVEQLAATG
jgi:hypothetical protein